MSSGCVHQRLDPCLPSASLISFTCERKNNFGKKTDTHRAATKKEAQTENNKELPSSPPKKKVEYSRVPRRAFSPCPPGSNCLFSSLNVLCLHFGGVAAIEKMSAKVLALVDRSWDDGVLPP